MAKVCKSQNSPRRIHHVAEDFDEENEDLDSDDSIDHFQGAVKRQYFADVEQEQTEVQDIGSFLHGS